MTGPSEGAGRGEVRRAVAELVRRRPGVAEDQERLSGYLRDLCPHRPAEVAVILVAAGAGVPDELKRATEGHALEALAGRLAARLQSESGIDGELARWAVDTWALALRAEAARPPPDDLRAMVAGAPAPFADQPTTAPPPAPPVAGPTTPPRRPEAVPQTVHRKPLPADEAPPAVAPAPSWRDRARTPLLAGGALAAVLVLVVVVAVAGGGGDEDAPPPEPALAASTTAVPTSVATTPAPAPTTVATTTPATPLPAPPADLRAGRYMSATLQPGLALTVPEGWRFRTQRTDLVEFSPQDAPGHILSVLRPARTLRRDRAFATGAETQQPDAAEPAPADLIAWLRSHERLSVSAATPVTVNGVTGTQVDVTVRSGYRSGACGAPCVLLFQLDDGIVFNLAEGNLNRVYSLTVGGTAVLVVAEAGSDVFPAFATRFEPIVRTMAFTR